MIKLILTLFLSLNLFVCEINCESELQDTLSTIQKVEGANELLERVLKDGPLTIKIEKEFVFGAYWDCSKRIIAIVPEENKIYSLLFELHNAAAQDEFDHYNLLAYQNQISKEDYVRAFECIEYQNVLKTAAIVDEGIREGIFPASCQNHYHSNFEEHFAYQKLTGHSAYVAGIYDSLIS